MIAQKSQEKIKSLIKDINQAAHSDPARKLIIKYYDLASTINQQMPAQKDEELLTQKQKQQKRLLNPFLKQLKDSFDQFQQSKMNEIKMFNQVEYYMYQQTERILHKFQPTIVDIVVDKLNAIKRIFIKPETYKWDKENAEIQDTTSSLSDKKPTSEKRFQQSHSHESPNFHSQNSLPAVTRTERSPSTKSPTNSWQRVKQFYESHRLDEAYEELLLLQKNNDFNPKSSGLTPQQKELAQTIKFEYKTMSDFYEHFYDTGYTFDKEDKGISLWYKIVGEKDVAIKVEAEVDITIENFLCIASEINLFEDYIPFTYGTKELKSISRNEKIGTSKVYIPLLTDRETYFYAAAYDRLRTKGSIFFFSKTINQDLQYQQKYNFTVPPQSEFVRLQYKYYILQYVPLTKTRGKINMVSSIDLKMDYLPMWLINKSARVFSFDYMRNYHRINKKFEGSKWDKVKKQKRELYDFFQQKIDQYLGERGN